MTGTRVFIMNPLARMLPLFIGGWNKSRALLHPIASTKTIQQVKDKQLLTLRDRPLT